MKNYYSLLVGFFLLLNLLIVESSATIGANGIHDPSTIIKHEGVYHVFGTGHGGNPEQGVPLVSLIHLTSTDLIHWTEVEPVFESGTWPEWINDYVSDFGGIFWAPDIIFMNGLYHLYYSVSMGDRPCAIGLTTSPDLNNWTDRGMVIYSDHSSIYGSIDPAVFEDAEGDYWMVFGSHLRGIWITEIDPETGKRPENATLTNIAGGVNWIDYEASYVIYHDGFYYLFFTQGACCRLMESTYRVYMGRSTNPKGPYLDKNGLSLLQGGRTLSLETSGRYIGPGHYGLLKEDGRNIISLHYYDGRSNGYPRLDLVDMEFGEDGWPVVTRDLIPDGKYHIKNVNSGLVWEAQGCTGGRLQPIVQNAIREDAPCQIWELSSVGDGYYKLKNAITAPSFEEQVVDVPFCDTNNALATYDWLDNDCQKFRIMRNASGHYVFSSMVNADRIISVPQESVAEGAELFAERYTGSLAQQWELIPIEDTGTPIFVKSIMSEDDILVYPNPASFEPFFIRMNSGILGEGVVQIISMDGNVLYNRKHSFADEIMVDAKLSPGVYLLRLHFNQQSFVKKLMIAF
ncbi:family 43 glycosylhydrolase [Natronoflexus pectinivorans]|uniref:Arabinan endo-1,5-alpha-L-arabinosidase n=1 Tax=Natronoflexus pectinivorans TaxID=682526 RepID=A0A4R2GGF4_9BACT|nr:family 43 glycosylhydrolase [Natronoflexus pectinivorans]TCO07115.1 arabinan endo-1,5-alpha-L-arabinosidase [Natronoflexus pectinivorans]